MKTEPQKTELIVLTGGPGAGKTAILEFVRKILDPKVTILPEAASILFGGGFWRMDSVSAKQASQRAIYYVQSEMQKLVLNEGKWLVGLCDRGTLDGVAYWPGPEEEFFSSLNTTREIEYARYKAVIHLRTPSRKNGYNNENPLRIESVETASQIDQRIAAVWKSHPNYCAIDSTRSFKEKLDESVVKIWSFLPDCCREVGKETPK